MWQSVAKIVRFSNCAAKLRRILTKSAVTVRHFQLIFGSNWLQHQKQQKHLGCLAEGFGIFLEFEIIDKESTASRFIQSVT